MTRSENESSAQSLLSSEGPDELVSSASALIHRGQAENVVKPLREAIANHPDHLRLWHVLGLAYRDLQDSTGAMEAFGKAEALAPTDPKITHALARVTMEAGLPAVALFDKARPFSPADGTLLMGRSAAQLANAQGKQAIADLEEILDSSPMWLEGQNLLASLYWMLDRRDAFTQGYEKALRSNPKEKTLWLKMIDSLIQAERYEEAEETVMRGRAEAGADRSFNICEAICASELADNRRADRLFQSLFPIQEILVAVRYMRHMLRTGRPSAAIEHGMLWINHPLANEVWPYLALAWRITGDVRWRWLEDNPRLIGVYDIGDSLDMDALAACLRELHAVTQKDMVGQSVRGGTQTDGPLFARIEPEILALKAKIIETVESHMNSLGSADPTHPVLRHPPCPVRFAGSWSVRLNGAGHHTNHIHPMGWFSSAFYVTLPDTQDLGEPPSGWLAFGQAPAELGLDLEPFHIVEAKPGRLAMFPSIMWHGTIPFERGERMTVAYDVAPPVPAA